MRRAPKTLQRPSVSPEKGFDTVQGTDPVDPTPRTQPVARLQRPSVSPDKGFDTVQGTDPVDPTPRTQPLSRLAASAPLPRAKPARRAQRAVKPAKRRATSRRR